MPGLGAGLREDHDALGRVIEIRDSHI